MKTNQLALEKSPYLLQHAHNPVDWLPWGEAAFEKARRENKPIFLSIGYSTCHWCHVMERESFENEAVAQIMNDGFINIKVDREERPDVDRIYMTFVQATTGSGGWPMSVFLTPDLKPFYGGTYFPPDDRHARPGFASLLQHLANAWKDDRANIEKSAQSTTEALRRYADLDTVSNAKSSTRNAANWREIADQCYRQFAASYDEDFGGFGAAPKFPRPVTHDFLHLYNAIAGDADALKISLETLRAMVRGGLNDQLGGGFHRYSVDSQWIVSHFEKMLYDQAQLVMSLLEAVQLEVVQLEVVQLDGDELFADAARQTLDYVLRDLTHQNGGFYAGEDADSFAPSASSPLTVSPEILAPNSAVSSTRSAPNDAETAPNAPENSHKEEGAFYVWTQAEIEAILGLDAPLFCAFFGVQNGGNAPRKGDPHGEFRGKNILFRAMEIEEIAAQFGVAVEDALRVLEASKTKLFAVRATRPRPHRDEKIIAAWNGMMISAFAKAAQILGEARYATAAQRALQTVFDELWDEESARLRRHFKDGAAQVWAFADDYACVARACLDVYEIDFDVAHLRRAERVLETLKRDFWDEDGGGFFASSPDENLLLRLKDDYDGAEPSANSVAARTLLSLANLLHRDDLRADAVRTVNAFSTRVAQIPQAMPELLCAALQSETPPQHVVIVGDSNADDTRELLRAARIEYSIARAVILRDPNDAAALQFWNERAPWTRDMTQQESRATAYFCRDFACQAPTNSPQELRRQLRNQTPKI